MYKMLYLSKQIEPFKSYWGAWAIPQPHENGYILPLGWERELTLKGIEFTQIEITPQDESQDLP